MKTIYIFGYNIISAITAILLRNYFGYKTDVRIVTLNDIEQDIPEVMESNLIKDILDLNGVSIEEFMKATNASPFVGSVYKDFFKNGSIKFFLNSTNSYNQEILKYKNKLHPDLKEEDNLDFISKLAPQFKQNVIKKDLKDNYSFTFDTKKAATWLIEEVFVKRLKGRLLNFDIKNIVYQENGYVNFIETSLNEGLPFKAALYINCADKTLNTSKTKLPYNNALLTASVLYKNKDKQINNHNLYFAKDNGYIFERYLWNRIEVTYFYNKDHIRKADADFVIGDHVLKRHKIYYSNFKHKEIYSNEVKEIYNKDILDLSYYNNYVEPLIQNQIDNIINKVYHLIELFEDRVIFARIHKNYFNKESKKIDNKSKLEYLSFLSNTENNQNSYWNKIFEADIDCDLNLKNCISDIRKHKTFDPEFYRNLWKKELLYLNNYAVRNTNNCEPLSILIKRINK